MAKYRGKLHLQPHPKIHIWSHAKRTEIEYFQEMKQHYRSYRIMPEKHECWKPQDLIPVVAKWKRKKGIKEDNGDQVWCIFDVDDFYKNDPQGLLDAISLAHANKIRIAYSNECFELWILLHFERPSGAIIRDDLEGKIDKYFSKNGLGTFRKLQRVFIQILPFQESAIKNSKSIIGYDEYAKIDWGSVLKESGNPSTNIHLLIGEIRKII